MRALVTSMVPLSIRHQRVIGSRCRLAGTNIIFVYTTNSDYINLSSYVSSRAIVIGIRVLVRGQTGEK